MQKNPRIRVFVCLLVPVCASLFMPGRCSCAEPPANNALVVIEPGKAPGAARKYITDNEGRIGDSFSPNVFMGDVPAALDGELGAKHGAVIFREEIPEPEGLARYGEAAIAAAKVWNNNLEVAAEKPPPSEKKHLEVVLETDGVNFKLISKKVRKGPRSVRRRQTLAEGFYYLEAVSASGETLLVQSLVDPTKVYYDFGDGSGAMKGGIYTAAKAEMVISLPYDQNIKTLRISRQKASVKGKSLKSEKPSRATKGSRALIGSDLEPKALVDIGPIPEDNK